MSVTLQFGNGDYDAGEGGAYTPPAHKTQGADFKTTIGTISAPGDPLRRTQTSPP